MARSTKPQQQPAALVGTTPLMDDEALARRLNVKVSWVEDAAKAGRIPCTFIGRHRRYTEAHFQQIVAAGERPATAPLAA
ncbi:helix-turn-helix domain-containing protein [Micromonospora sp. NPDC023633]|uniref:helix-turn-helix domain-containing protein n=1 Tax=Micromonospora sp. NPDC023633 TaxID=3154320 RepID=UPI0034100AE6